MACNLEQLLVYRFNRLSETCYRKIYVSFVRCNLVSKMQFNFICHSWCLNILSGNYTSNRNWVCFVCYLKIINTFFERWYSYLKANCRRNSKNVNLSSPSGSWVIEKIMMFRSIAQEPLDLLKIMPFWVSETICFMVHILFLKTVMTIVR